MTTLTITKGGGYTIISHMDDDNIYHEMRYMFYPMRECITKYRAQFGLKGKRVKIVKEY